MRRGALVLVLALGFTGLAQTVLAASQTVADDFSSGGYSGSTGNTPWASSWQEVGESNGPGEGNVSVETDGTCATGRCLTIVSGLGAVGAKRSVDLEEATEATLSYHFEFPRGLLTLGQVGVEARSGAGAWQTLETHGPGDAGTYLLDLPVGNLVEIQFVMSGLAVSASAGVDDVMVVSTSPDPTTTTSSSSTTTSTTSATSTTSPTSSTSSTSSATTSSTTTATTTPSTTSTPPSENGQEDEESEPGVTFGFEDGPPPSETQGVVTDLSPQLGPLQSLQLEPQSNLLVAFSTNVEDISIDLLASAALGFFFAILWSRRLNRAEG